MADVSKRRVGVIGCGKISERHLQGYSQLPVEVVVADIDKSLAESLAQKFDVACAGHSDELLEDPEIECIDICVPTRYHHGIAIRALQNGKHVFCEKPLSSSLDEAREIQTVAHETGRVMMVGFLQRFHPAFREVRRVLDTDVIGAPHLAIFRVGGRGDHAAWKHQRGVGGGVVPEMLVHKLDQIVWFLGAVTDVNVMSASTMMAERKIQGKNEVVDAEDYIVLELKAGGATVLCEADFVTPGYMDYLELQGENGSVFSSLLHYMPTIVFCKEGRGGYESGNNMAHYPEENLFALELEHFISAVGEGQNAVNTVEDSLHVMEIVEEIGRQTGGSH